MEYLSAPRVGAAWALLVCFLWTTAACAQTDQERAGARVAARDGIEAYNKGDYEEALRLLERAQSLVDAPTHLLFIARSRVKLGKLVEAREAYRKIITANLPPNAPRAFLAAQEDAPVELAEIEARIGKIKIDIKGPSGEVPAGLVVKVNGIVLSPALIGLAVPANPGKNEIIATADGMLSASKSIDLDEGGNSAVDLKLKADPNFVPADSLDDSSGKRRGDENPPDQSGETPQEGANPKRTAGWVTASTGAVVAVTGGVFGALSMAQLTGVRNDEALCGEDKLCTTEGREQVNAAQTKALVADIAMGVGVLAVGVGTYLIVTSKPNAQKVGIRSVVPSADPHGGYLLMKGGF